MPRSPRRTSEVTKKKKIMLTQEEVDARNAGVVFVFAFVCVWTVCHVLCLGHRESARALL